VIDEHLLDDADIAGPVVYCLILGGLLLLSGKVDLLLLFFSSSLYLLIGSLWLYLWPLSLRMSLPLSHHQLARS
jgi:protein YIPF5/7